MLNIELRDLIRAIVRNEFEETYGIACRVTEVREDDVRGWVVDCEPINESATLLDVRLQANKGGQILITPAVDSVVYVIKEDESNAFVSMYSTVDNIIFLGGDNGGVPISQSISDKLNVLEDRITGHQHQYIPYPGGAAGPPVPTTPDTASNPSITPTTPEDLENNLFLH